MKNLIRKLALILAPVGTIVVLVNYFVDPGNIFCGRDYVKRIAGILLTGHNVDNLGNYDERELQEQIISRLPYRPDVVVLGSSRIMELGSDFFPGKKVLNCGVSHGNINDLVAITGLLDSMHKMPAEMVINVDPHLICQGGTSEWQTLRPYYDHMAARLHLPADGSRGSLVMEKMSALCSFGYFEKSLNFISHHRSGGFRDVGKAQPRTYGRYPDGTISYPGSYCDPDTMNVASDALVIGGKEVVTLDQAKANRLSKLVDYLQSRGVKVLFVMLPYHKEYYLTMNERFGNVFNSYAALFRQFAREKSIPIRGGFDAVRLGIPENEFYDSWHCSREAIKKVYNQN
ncbi:MAG TPA: hypothetical protein VN616_01175 [Puia sp.]|nr:hypothetical protein [Puia sp.]